MRERVAPIRAKIESRRDCLVSRVNQIADDILGKLNEFEMESEEGLDEMQSPLDESELEGLAKCSDKWREEMRMPQIENEVFDKLLAETRKLLNENQLKYFEQKRKVFI